MQFHPLQVCLNSRSVVRNRKRRIDTEMVTHQFCDEDITLQIRILNIIFYFADHHSSIDLTSENVVHIQKAAVKVVLELSFSQNTVAFENIHLE